MQFSDSNDAVSEDFNERMTGEDTDPKTNNPQAFRQAKKHWKELSTLVLDEKPDIP